MKVPNRSRLYMREQESLSIVLLELNSGIFFLHPLHSNPLEGVSRKLRLSLAPLLPRVDAFSVLKAIYSA